MIKKYIFDFLMNNDVENIQQNLDWYKIFSTVVSEKIEGLLFKSLIEHNLMNIVPKPIKKNLYINYKYNQEKNALYIREFKKVQNILFKNRIQVYPYKGLSLLNDIYNDGELDMLAITNMSIDYYDNSYAIFTLFTIQNNKIKKVPFTTLDGLIEIIPGMDAAFHMVSNNFVVGNNYGAYKDSIELKHRKDTSIVGRNIAFDKSKTRFYVVNNKYFTIKTNDGSGRESEIFLYYGKGDELYNYRESLAELYKNPQFGGNKDDYINKWRKNTELSEEIINKFGITSDCAIWIYNNNDQTSKVSPWSFLPLYEYFLEIGENMKNNFYDTINYSKIYISENEDDNGENIKSLKRIIFYENNIDNRTKYLTK